MYSVGMFAQQIITICKLVFCDVGLTLGVLSVRRINVEAEVLIILQRKIDYPIQKKVA